MESYQGLQPQEVAALQQQYGKNKIALEEKGRLGRLLWDVVTEPMFLMLAAACTLYFLLHQPSEGFMMLTAMCFVAAISFYQEARSARALQALSQLTAPQVKVIRQGTEQSIDTEELVPGDLLLLAEGERVPADAVVLRSHDLSVDESALTGESVPVEKDAAGNNKLFQGTIINRGQCLARTTATGPATELGKLGKAIVTHQPVKTRLQQHISRLVRRLAFFGIGAFLIIFSLNYFKSNELVGSLLFGLTLAMAALPEEIPVAFSSFMALGAYHMARRGIITRQPQTVENLGAITVICLDKTGTITENKMVVHWLYDATADKTWEGSLQNYKGEVLQLAMLASERKPFDSMEQAILEAGEKAEPDWVRPDMVHEYPLEGRPPMMTHVFRTPQGLLAAAKGAVERIVAVCRLAPTEAEQILALAAAQAAKGYRVLGVAQALPTNEQLPQNQDDFNWQFAGLLALFDPPKAGIQNVMGQFKKAGINIKLLTGDHSETAANIAAQVGVPLGSTSLTGEAVLGMRPEELRQQVRQTNLFARMFPEAKLRVIEALKANGETVAMTGDGINDGPAIRAAQVGIAMGKKGTEVARQAADLILTNDDLAQVAEGVRQGRRIFTNLKKAVRYIISIHIPIILTASLPLILGWQYPNIFTPVHVIFLELIMGPTCSVFFEREPAERDSMQVPPRAAGAGLLSTSDAVISILQGLVITAGVLVLYYRFMQQGASLELTRTVVFVTLICSNILLTFVNRSFTATLRTTIKYPNNLAPFVLGASLFFLAIVLLVPPVRGLFGMVTISVQTLLLCAAVAAVSVLWLEVYKFLNLKHQQ